MVMNRNIVLAFLVLALLISCSNSGNTNSSSSNNIEKEQNEEVKEILPGAYNTAEYLDLISGKSVGLVTNQTGIIKDVHLVDTLLSLGVNLVKIFCPEHGFRGTADAGEHIDDNIDTKTGLQIVSLYGANRKPKDNQLTDIDIMLFDLQDVGVRFYTYISTLHYVMEACAENDIPLIVFDRPNPNAYYIDGPVLNTAEIHSFIGMHPVPVVYGMTIGEYGKMINGEGWLKNGIKCYLTVIPIQNYNHNMPYSLPVRPSPNLPNDRSIDLYPTLCYFEGTTLSIGRGTEMQFQVIGHPLLGNVAGIDFNFTPQPNLGAQNPVFNGQVCFGFDLREDYDIFNDIYETGKLNIGLIIKTYELFPDKQAFFLKNNMFDLLAGNYELRKQIINSVSEEEIRQSWEPELSNFKEIRTKHLIY